MTSFDMRQRNTLKTGTNLAAELPASSEQLRAFIVIGAYAIDVHGKRKDVSKFLNAANQEIRFWVEKYEIDKRYINSWDADLFIVNRKYQDNITAIEELETEIVHYIDDFSLLVGAWNCDNPLP